MAYAILRTDKMMSTRVESMLVTFRYQDSSADAPIENGNIVELDGLMEGEREVFLAKAPPLPPSWTTASWLTAWSFSTTSAPVCGI